ncbi:hypothetical protein SAMN04487995_0599 [Dyadobacter koreensis]|uniref:DUF4468 domain-containing protein n=1 Tax=Dyadobacter koreensis TaxID=408657 RepID=A0A1H6QF72_9BACT|nr:hypothetical protein [Dyadobacter koreensis]SEI42359.1 hypothetical protein SAMN04487995_0599 [Dyadobacter koreensis]
MKKLSLLTFVGLIFSQVALHAQDMINQKDGVQIKAKVLEVTVDEVKYKKFDFQDGPTYSKKKAELSGITYSNGEEEIFKVSDNRNKKMFIWGPSTKKIELPKLELKEKTKVYIADNRKEPVKKSVVEFTSKELVELVKNLLGKETSGNISFVETEIDALGSSNGVSISIDAYDATFYPGAWHTETRYFVKTSNDGVKGQKEIESLKGAFNTFGHATAKSRLTKSFEEATSKLIEFINSKM